MLLLFRGNADAGVGHGEVQHGAAGFTGFAGLQRAVHADLAAVGELDGIAHQVQQNLPQPHLLAHNPPGHRSGHGAAQAQPFFLGPQGKRLNRLVHQLVQIERDQLHGEHACLDFREVQDVVNDGQQGIGRSLHNAEKLSLLRRQLGFEHQAGHAQDAVHGGADLVAHVGEKFAFGPVG